MENHRLRVHTTILLVTMKQHYILLQDVGKMSVSFFMLQIDLVQTWDFRSHFNLSLLNTLICVLSLKWIDYLSALLVNSPFDTG